MEINSTFIIMDNYILTILYTNDDDNFFSTIGAEPEIVEEGAIQLQC